MGNYKKCPKRYKETQDLLKIKLDKVKNSVEEFNKLERDERTQFGRC